MAHIKSWCISCFEDGFAKKGHDKEIKNRVEKVRIDPLDTGIIETVVIVIKGGGFSG